MHAHERSGTHSHTPHCVGIFLCPGVPFSRSNVQIEQTICPQIGLQIGDAQFPGTFNNSVILFFSRPIRFHNAAMINSSMFSFFFVSFLVGFYLMSQFHIAELARRGILRNVVGSTPQQLAYRIGPEFNFRINTR